VIIQELKPSNRVSGRWLAVLEDNSILRLGECEVIDFALYAGKELSDEEKDKIIRTGLAALMGESDEI